jgi:hypothetical protein
MGEARELAARLKLRVGLGSFPSPSLIAPSYPGVSMSDANTNIPDEVGRHEEVTAVGDAERNENENGEEGEDSLQRAVQDQDDPREDQDSVSCTSQQRCVRKGWMVFPRRSLKRKRDGTCGQGSASAVKPPKGRRAIVDVPARKLDGEEPASSAGRSVLTGEDLPDVWDEFGGLVTASNMDDASLFELRCPQEQESGTSQLNCTVM